MSALLCPQVQDLEGVESNDLAASRSVGEGSPWGLGLLTQERGLKTLAPSLSKPLFQERIS